MYYPKSIPTNWVIVIVSDILSVEKKNKPVLLGKGAKKIVDFFIKVGGFPLIPLIYFFSWKKYKIKPNKIA